MTAPGLSEKEAITIKRTVCFVLAVILLTAGTTVLSGASDDFETAALSEGQSAHETEAEDKAESGLSEASSAGAEVTEAASVNEESSVTSSAAAQESGTTAGSTRTVRLDVSLTGPPNLNEIWYAAHKSTDKRNVKNDITGQMEAENPVAKDPNTWRDYVVNLPQGYDQIVFASYEIKNSRNLKRKGESTTLLSIPDDLENPCFYMDADDPSIYEDRYRGGFWEESFRIRDPEEEADSDLVEIPEGSMTSDGSILYLDSELFDYYTDSELNGLPRGSCGSSEKSQRTWVPFRNLDEALSDVYQKNGGIPLYVGHFQPDVFEENRFSEIAPLLNLTGWEDPTGFFSTNNSTLDALGNGSAEDRKYEYAAQGLIGRTLKNGYPVCAPLHEETSLKSAFPLFSESFLEGSNIRNTKIGKVYHHTAFPFYQTDRDGDGILYWSFDSAKDHAHLMKEAQKSENGFEYFLGDPSEASGEYGWSENVTSSGSAEGDPISDQYGFFPLNSLEANADANAYNFGFGVRLAFDFNLPENAVLKDQNGREKPVIFTFSGDDDLWVFLDGELVLDVGGDHGKVEGTINFADQTAFVSNVKKSQGDPDTEEGPKTTSFTLNPNDNEKHHLVLFYMERGMWESNLKLQFNMAPERIKEEEPTELPHTGERGIPKAVLLAGAVLVALSVAALMKHNNPVSG